MDMLVFHRLMFEVLGANCECLTDLKLCQDDMVYVDVQVLGNMCK